MLTQAYLIAAWSRSKKLPKLEKILENSRPKRQVQQHQTPEQMLRMTRVLHSAMTKGG